MNNPLPDTLECTCTSFPSQWEGHDDEGRYVYVRYRFGRLTVERAQNALLAGSELLVTAQVGGRYDGEMSEATMREIVGRIAAQTRAVAWDRDEAEPCQAGTAGCSIDHAREDQRSTTCEPW